jgi:Cu(I)/Ag(I) efflux system membrane fusion protein
LRSLAGLLGCLMGMDYIPVCEDEGAPENGNVVKVSLDLVQRLGVRSEVVEERALALTVLAFASVQHDQAPRGGGRPQVRRLDREALPERHRRRRDGRPEAVRHLQPRAQRAATGIRPVAQHAGAGRRCRPKSRICAAASGCRAPSPLLRRRVAAPEAGTVIEKMAANGMRYQPGEVLSASSTPQQYGL